MNIDLFDIKEDKQQLDSTLEFLYIAMLDSMTNIELQQFSYEVDEADRLYRNIVTIEALRTQYSSDEVFEEVTKNIKGFKLTKAMSAILTKITSYFDKFFAYIGNVLLLNVNAVEKELIAHLSKLETKDYLDKAKEKNLTGPTISSVIRMITSAEKLIIEEKNRITKIATLTRESDASKFNDYSKLNNENALKEFGEVSELCKTENEDIEKGGWLDSGKLKELQNKIKPLQNTIKAVAELRKETGKIVETIKSSRESESDELTTLKKSLLNYLKTDLIKEFKSIIGELAKTINSSGKILSSIGK